MNNLMIALLLLEEMENSFTNIRNPRGFGVGHPHWKKKSGKQLLGSSEYELEDEEEKQDNELEKVKISRAFKK